MGVKVSYGRAAMLGSTYGGMYGAGFGKDKGISEIAVAQGEWLSKRFPSKHFEVRCNTDGESCGAHNDEKYGFRLSVRRYNEKITYDAGFNTDRKDLTEKDIPNTNWIYIPKTISEQRFIEDETRARSVSSKQFKTQKGAMEWLLKYGSKYCPGMGGRAVNTPKPKPIKAAIKRSAPKKPTTKKRTVKAASLNEKSLTDAQYQSLKKRGFVDVTINGIKKRITKKNVPLRKRTVYWYPSGANKVSVKVMR